MATAEAGWHYGQIGAKSDGVLAHQSNIWATSGSVLVLKSPILATSGSVSVLKSPILAKSGHILALKSPIGEKSGGRRMGSFGVFCPKIDKKARRRPLGGVGCVRC
ncbi:MAG: hypothetical protein IPN76_29685 [Saprospiraceae bacterium]|nr:hypothetical protein [Saprospiraceae bacterium]